MATEGVSPAVRTAAVLALHEIEAIEIQPVRSESNPRVGGFWVAIARCKCGHTSPPEHRVAHYISELTKVGLM